MITSKNYLFFVHSHVGGTSERQYTLSSLKWGLNVLFIQNNTLDFCTNIRLDFRMV
jgi:hypothetical protein